MRIKPFPALRPPAERAAEVASYPYDVVTTEEARALAQDHPCSFLHVVKPEIDLPPNTDPYADEVYAKAAENLKLFQDNGYLERETEDCFYVYRQIMGEHEQSGLVCVCHVEDYERDIIKKHEKTRPDKEDDRTRLTSTLRANSGPVFLTYQERDDVQALIAEIKTQDPVYNFTASDDIRHTVWRTPKTEALVEAFQAVAVAYVADGHHRSASAARVARENREANANHRGDEDYNWFLSVLFPAHELKVLAYNRCVKDLNGHTEAELLDGLKPFFKVEPTDQPEPGRVGSIRMYLAGQWYDLTWTALDSDDPVASLDVSILQDRLLAPLLGIEDPRSSKRIDFVGGIHGTDRLKTRVDAGTYAVAFSLYPTTIEQLMAVADAGRMMPPKSTWFEPKLRSGLLVHTF